MRPHLTGPRPSLNAPLSLAVLSAGFLLLALAVRGGHTQSLDEAVVRGLRSAVDPAATVGPRWLPESARDVTALGSLSVLLLTTVALSGFLALGRHFQALALVWTATLGGFLSSLWLKGFFDRARPSVVPHLTFTVTKSFPSGHAMLSAVTYLTLGALVAALVNDVRLKRYVVGCSVFIALLVGASRVYLGVHYPTDVVGGWLAGGFWAVASAWTTRRLRRESAALREGVD